MTTPSDDELLASGHFEARRLEALAARLRAEVTAAKGSARARLVRRLGELGDMAEALVRRRA